MRRALVAMVLALLVVPLRAADPPMSGVTVVTKDGRYAGTLSISQVEVKTGSGTVKAPLSGIASVQFGDVDVIRMRDGKRVKGVVGVDGWTLREGTIERPLARADLRFIVPQIPIGPLRK